METPARQVSDSKASRTRTPRASAPATSSTDNRLSHTSNLYELWALDIVPAIGFQAAEIFETNPKQFKRVPPSVADVLARLHYQTGHNESYLSISQRVRLVGPLLGESDGTDHSDETSKFHKAATGLRKAAVDYVQRSFDTGERQLRNAFRDAAKTMYAYLTILEGGVTTSALGRLSTHFGDVVTVLQNVEYCSGLGLPPAPTGRWPRFGIVDGDGAAVVAELARRAIPDESTTVAQIDVEKFLAIQRVADYGAASLDEILVDPAMEDDARADETINIVYRWWTALRDAGVIVT
jgi:hypothetical protein